MSEPNPTRPPGADAAARAETLPPLSEARYRALFHALDEGIALWEALVDERGQATGDHRLLEANPAWGRITDRDATAAVGGTMSELFPALEAGWYEACARAGLERAAAALELRVDRLDRWFRIQFAPLGPGDRRQFVAMAVDITERKQAEQALRQAAAAARFRLALTDALRSLPEPAEMQATASRLLGEHLGVNRVTYASLEGELAVVGGAYVRGVAPLPTRFSYEPLGRGLREPFLRGEPVMSGDVSADPRFGDSERATLEAFAIRAFVAAVLIKGDRMVAAFGVHSCTARIWTPDELQLVQETGERIWAAVERARAEAALREREADLARVQRIGQVGGVTIDVARGLTGHRSPEYLRLHGLTAAAASESHDDWLRRVHPDDRERADRTLAEALAGDGPVYASEYRIVRPSDGAVRWIRARADIERDGQGRPRFLFGAHLDVTEQKQLEAALRESEGRQSFLVRLGDALRPLADPLDIQGRATHLLGRHVRANRVHYGEVRDGLLHIQPGYTDGLAPMPGPMRLADLGPAIVATCHAGRTAVCRDALADPTITPSQLAIITGAGFRAYLVIPLLKEGTWLAWLAVHSTEPRDWTPDDIALAEETAERTWAAVERARAEAALQRAHDGLERRVAERTAELARVNRELRDEARERLGLQRQLATAQEDERHRVARDLHDQTGQLLASLSLAVRAVATAGPLSPASSERLAEAERLTDELSRQAHALAVRLRPVALDDLGLAAALRDLVDGWSSRTGVPVDLQTVGLDGERLPAEVETVLYRVVQEALTNVARHAHASLVSVVVSRHDGHATASVEDDGRGFDPSLTGARHLGLRGMLERVTQVGGQLDVESSPGAGTTILARLPARPTTVRPPPGEL